MTSEHLLFNRQDSNCLKGFAILMVMLGHLRWLNIASIGVILFLFISGYGVFCSYQNKGLNHYFKNKIHKIWIPYVLIFILSYIIHPCYNLIEFIISILGFNPNPKTDPTMWYISYLFLFYISFFVIIKATIHKILLSIGLSGFIIFLSFFVYDKSFAAFLYIPFFPLGVLTAKFLKKDIFKGLPLLFITLVATCLLYQYNQRHVLIYAIYIYTGAICSLCFIRHIGAIYKTIFSILGKYSYSIYLVEGLFLVRYKNELNLLNSKAINNIIKIGGVILSAILLQVVVKSFVTPLLNRKRTNVL